LKPQWSTYAYNDPAQESKRLSVAAERQKVVQTETEKKPKHKRSETAWSKQIAKKEEKEKRREQKVRKRKWLRNQDLEKHVKPKAPCTSDDVDDVNDWEELAKEERMAKKMKKGQISQSGFEKEFLDLP
jgi:ATP-dependent RNA helicase DDX55/SPB4